VTNHPLSPQPSTRNQSTLPSSKVTQNATPSTLSPQPSTLSPQPSTLYPQPSTLHPDPLPLTLYPTPGTLNPIPSTLNPQPHTLNPKQSQGSDRSFKDYISRSSLHQSAEGPPDVSIEGLGSRVGLGIPWMRHPKPETLNTAFLLLLRLLRLLLLLFLFPLLLLRLHGRRRLGQVSPKPYTLHPTPYTLHPNSDPKP